MNKEISELISYIIVGGCTTLVNFIVYYFMIRIGHTSWLLANVISWLFAVIFAYYTNKKIVFKSNNQGISEGIQFFVLRLTTLLVESGLLWVLIQLLVVDEMIAKIIVSVVTIVTNYGLCKFKIFAGGN